MGETQGETGPQHESAGADGAPDQATPGPVTDQPGGAGTAGAQSVSDASEGAGLEFGAGGIAVAARDTRRRVLGVPIGKRSRFQRRASVVADAASTVVEKVREPAKRVGSRFSRDP